jgi:hypothetical protein
MYIGVIILFFETGNLYFCPGGTRFFDKVAGEAQDVKVENH